ncbi:MAG: hypothetical protein KIT80_22075 [Chitinophagaceae bacterium]|nr:hypothetical protein [Chitinophagaceae bacterium]MCW5929624.1 hypothetical protein [Chitinophagaceae bacterium]
MDNTTIIILAVVIIVSVFGAYLLVYRKDIKGLKKEETKAGYDKSLQLQAYERLVILAERISLRNLIGRVSPTGTALAYQAALVDTIRQEYDYNLSQQLYVSSQAWQAVSSLKEQNIFILHQLSGLLPREATGADLAKKVLELLDSDPKTSLHTVVLEALKFDAGKLLKNKN